MKKIKVAFLLNHFRHSNGVARALIGLCNNLDLNKYDITIVPMYQLDETLADALDARIKIKKLFGFYFRGFDGIANRMPLKMLYKKTLNSEYDIEVAFQCGLPTRLVGYSKNKNAVHVIWMHTFDMYEDCFSKADKVICVSKENSGRCKEIMGDSVNVDYCYNLVEDNKVVNNSIEVVAFKNNFYPRFVSVGRHSPEKGYIRLVKIFGSLKNEGYKFSLVLVGDGVEYDSISRTVREEKLEEYIELVGMQTNPYKYVSKSDLFICSSFSEGYSTACTEAAILGIPIITTSVGGAKEIIEECGCGVMCGCDDMSLKSAIKEVLDNPELINKWKENMKISCEKFKLPYRLEKAKTLFEEFEKMKGSKI